jgi:hypothetical protein
VAQSFFFSCCIPFWLKEFPYLVSTVTVEMKMSEEGLFDCVLCKATGIEVVKLMKQHLTWEHRVTKVQTNKKQENDKNKFDQAFLDVPKTFKRKRLLPLIEYLGLEMEKVQYKKSSNTIEYSTFVEMEIRTRILKILTSVTRNHSKSMKGFTKTWMLDIVVMISLNYGHDIFELWRENYIDLKPKFEDRLEFLLASIQFYLWLSIFVIRPRCCHITEKLEFTFAENKIIFFSNHCIENSKTKRACVSMPIILFSE